MFENKSLKSSERSKQLKKSDKTPQRKAKSNSLVQRAVMAQNDISNVDAVQFKKLIDNNSVLNLLNSKSVQREAIPEEEEEPVQMEAIPEEEEEPLQMKMENKTGMPDNLKSGVESLSGIDMSDVRVHYNSDKPADVGALAYTQGTDIHVAPGQEKHLAHEAWHVVQQAQGRVQPTTQFKDVAINDDSGLESEADVMGDKALNT